MSPEQRTNTRADSNNADEYAVNAQYYEAVFPLDLRDGVSAGLRSVVPVGGTIVEIGSGTGIFTEVLADIVGPDGEVFAVEPSPVMRCGLLTRIVGSPAASRVTVLPADGLTVDLPDDIAAIDGLVLLHVLTHFAPDDRRSLWSRWLPRLAAGAVVVVDQQWPEAPQDVPANPIPGRALGRRRYEAVAAATELENAASPMLAWTMTYRTYEGNRLVGQDEVSFPSHVVGRTSLDEELHPYGLRPIDDQRVWAWRRTA